ncbi:hypothetical protein EJO66_22375 [Variovorax beijingensis]|uniref:MarR family transcriptional regulator n=1 Tax=Variovorax beijingensis TaxID=2496117 RepID=A0ABY0A210_9BURK|nr:hypothetical protein [Variovorax beijingensis]RSZ31999.1 hypothetical protein EJO66_22375 [Variovorax beijingensis]
MCLNLLRELSETPLPCTRADAALIDRLRLLDAAGLIKVLIPPPHVDRDDCLRQDAATVLEITSRGWEVLRTKVVEDEAPSLPMQPARSRSAALDRVRLAASFGRSSRHAGSRDTDG